MKTEEIMNNEIDEVIYVAEKITPKSGKVMKVVGGIATVLGVGIAIYKGAKHIAAKRKAKKEQEELDAMCEPINAVED